MAYAVGGCVRDSILNRKPRDWDIKHVVVDNEEFLYYKLPKLTVALIKGTAADKRSNISFDDMYMSGDALSICQAVRANGGTLTMESGGVGGFPAFSPVFGAMIGAASVYDMANQFPAFSLFSLTQSQF